MKDKKDLTENEQILEKLEAIRQNTRETMMGIGLINIFIIIVGILLFFSRAG